MRTRIVKGPETPPFVSIIIPVRNEARFIERSMTAIRKQTYPKQRTEVIVVDGMSTDNTREIVDTVCAGADISVRIVDNPQLIAPAALNHGLEHAQGDILIRVDGHCEIEPDYVENCVKVLRSGKADGVGGPIETIGEGLRSQAIAIAMSSTFGVGDSAFRTVDDREMYTDTVAFPAYTRDIVRRAGAFNEELVRNQDDEYNYRIRQLGGRILLSPDIRSRYYSRTTFRSLWRQYFQYGYWKVRVLQLHPRQMRIRQFVPVVFVSTLLLLVLLSLFSSVGRWLLAGMILSYVLLNISVAAYSVKGRLAAMPLVSLGFLILHFSYGFGWLVGLIAFGGRWRKGLGLNVREVNGTQSPS